MKRITEDELEEEDEEENDKDWRGLTRLFERFDLSQKLWIKSSKCTLDMGLKCDS